MKVAALVRLVEDPSLAHGVTGSTLRIDDPSLNALALALSLAACGSSPEVVALAAGPPSWDPALRSALALGAAAVLRAEHAGEGLTGVVETAAVLRSALPPGVDAIVTGAAATDHGSGALPAALAEVLQWPLLANVTAVSDSGGTLIAHVRASGGRRQSYGLELPAILVAAAQPAQSPYPTLARRFAANRAPVPVHSGPAHPGRPGMVLATTGPAWPRRRQLIQPAASARAADRLRSLMAGGISTQKTSTVAGAGAAEILATWLDEHGFIVRSASADA
jgi:electron transfer flavoprotein beta subunit